MFPHPPTDVYELVLFVVHCPFRNLRRTPWKVWKAVVIQKAVRCLLKVLQRKKNLKFLRYILVIFGLLSLRNTYMISHFSMRALSVFIFLFFHRTLPFGFSSYLTVICACDSYVLPADQHWVFRSYNQFSSWDFLVSFSVANENGQFTIVWNSCHLERVFPNFVWWTILCVNKFYTQVFFADIFGPIDAQIE